MESVRGHDRAALRAFDHLAVFDSLPAFRVAGAVDTCLASEIPDGYARRVGEPSNFEA